MTEGGEALSIVLPEGDRDLEGIVGTSSDEQSEKLHAGKGEQ